MEMNYDENVLHELELELHTRIVPGTEIMADVGSHHFIKSSAKSGPVLVPQPSDDESDPLNWSRAWKLSAFICVTMTAFLQGMGPLALAPMFPELEEAFDASLPDVIKFTGVAILVLGFSNFIWVPIATTFGRRPTLLFSNLICFGSCIWRARALTYGSFMGACVLNGIGAGPAETLQPQVIADIFFLHDRGFYNTIYFVFYFGSLMIGPIIAGPMAQNVGWRNFWWLNVGLFAAAISISFFAFPETKWHRVHPDELASAPKLAGTKVESLNGEKPQAMTEDIEDTTNGTSGLEHTTTAQRDPWLGRGKPRKQQFKLWQNNKHPFKSILIALWIPWKLFAFPIVEFASFVVSWSASCFLTLNLTQSEVFAQPPYNFSPTAVGFCNFAVLAGALIGLATAGPLSDWFSMWLTKRNRGIREPEMRLPTMIPYVCIMLLGNFIVAFGYQQQWDWKPIVIVGYTCAGIQVAALPSISSTYAIDSYKPVAGSVFVAITVNKNVWGYGFSEFITPWIMKSGFVPPIMTNMSLTLLWCLFGVPLYFLGKQCRIWTRNSSVHKVE